MFPGADLNGDPTNWYQYNERALKGLRREAGFATTETVFKYPLYRRFARATRDRFKGKSFRAAFYSSRIIIHARKG